MAYQCAYPYSPFPYSPPLRSQCLGRCPVCGVWHLPGAACLGPIDGAVSQSPEPPNNEAVKARLRELEGK